MDEASSQYGGEGTTASDSTGGLDEGDTSASGGTSPAVDTGPGPDPDTGLGSTSAETQGPGETDGGGSSDGGPPPTEQPATGMYAHCHDGSFGNCTADAPTCLHIQGEMEGFCTALECTNPALDCDPAPGGTAPVYCAGLTQTICALDCSAGQQCPVGMTCRTINIEPSVPEEICV